MAENTLHLGLLVLLSAIIYPGLLFLALLGFFSEWLERKMVAKIQHRVGPSYVGPAGSLQPLADFLKLLLAKEEVAPANSNPLLAKAVLSVGIASLSVSMLLLPLSLARLEAVGDIIVLLYLVVIIPLVSLSLAFISYPNPYVIVGFSRFISLAVVAEPAFAASLLIPSILAVRLENAPFTASAVSSKSLGLLIPEALSFSEVIASILMAVAVIAAIISSQAKLKLKPFDVVEAEQELIAGPLTEISGPTLALYKLHRNIEMAVQAMLISYIILGGPAPFSQWSIEGVAVLVLKYVLVLGAIIFARSVLGRVRIEESIAIVAKAALIPSLVALLVATVV